MAHIKKGFYIIYAPSPSWEDPAGVARAILTIRFGKFHHTWYFGEGDALRQPIRIRNDYRK